MLKNIMLATTALWAVTMPALAQETTPEATAEPVADVTRDTVVASVNGTDITVGQLIDATARLPAEYQALPPEYLFDGMVAQLIQQQLLADTIDEMPARVAITLANEERSLMAGEAVNNFLMSSITEEAVQAAYDAQYNAETAQTEYDADHILVATQEEAQAILERLEAGEDFAELARELSTDTGSGVAGGDLGWFLPEMMVEPFGSTVAGMEAGTISEPVETQFGWHIIKMNESRQQALPPLEVVRQQIEGELQQAAITTYLEELEAGAEVTRPEAGQFDPTIITNLELLVQ